jgi:hypothetical protein
MVELDSAPRGTPVGCYPLPAASGRIAVLRVARLARMAHLTRHVAELRLPSTYKLVKCPPSMPSVCPVTYLA